MRDVGRRGQAGHNMLLRLWAWLRDEHNRGALTLVGAAFAAVVAAGWALYVHPGNDQTGGVGFLKIGQIRAHPREPDFVEIVNEGNSEIDAIGYQICEHNFREADKNCCAIPRGNVVLPGESLRAWFFNPVKPAHLAEASRRQAAGELVCTGFSVSSDEIVELLDPSGREVDSKSAG